MALPAESSLSRGHEFTLSFGLERLKKERQTYAGGSGLFSRAMNLTRNLTHSRSCLAPIGGLLTALSRPQVRSSMITIMQFEGDAARRTRSSGNASTTRGLLTVATAFPSRAEGVLAVCN